MAVKDTSPPKPKVSGEKKKSEPQKTQQLRIKLVRSLIGRPPSQRETIKGLGLRKLNSEVIRQDRPEVRGMINKVPHLLEVEVLEKK